MAQFFVNVASGYIFPLVTYLFVQQNPCGVEGKPELC